MKGEQHPRQPRKKDWVVWKFTKVKTHAAIAGKGGHRESVFESPREDEHGRRLYDPQLTFRSQGETPK